MHVTIIFILNLFLKKDAKLDYTLIMVNYFALDAIESVSRVNHLQKIV